MVRMADKEYGNITYDQQLAIERIKDFDDVYNDSQGNDEFDDDGNIHIVRNGVRYCFYRGQGKGMFTEKHVPIYARKVDKILNKR